MPIKVKMTIQQAHDVSQRVEKMHKERGCNELCRHGLIAEADSIVEEKSDAKRLAIFIAEYFRKNSELEVRGIMSARPVNEKDTISLAQKLIDLGFPVENLKSEQE